MVIQHKCPNCGSDMKFDANKGMLSCEYCGSTIEIESNEDSKTISDLSQKIAQDFETFEAVTSAGTFGEGDAIQYQCKNCGAILITDKDTTATTCTFCGSPMILGDRLTGSLSPAKVIPFSINKENAITAFRKWCKNGSLTKRNFASKSRIKNITGIYVPFWLYDLEGLGEAHADCTKNHTHETDKDIYTESKHYDVYRKVNLRYNKIPVDASEKMSDFLMESLEPFNYEALKDFNTPYLAGYLAEKYNFTDKELLPRAKYRIEDYIARYIKSTIKGYSSTNIRDIKMDIKQRNAYYTLLPVWIIGYDFNNSDRVFAMNGQTGKIIGYPPISYGKAAAYFFGIGIVVFLLLEAITLLTGGII